MRAAMDPIQLLLRDIHLPDPISWWPPALGWWLLLLLTIMLIIICVSICWYRNKIRSAPATQARQILHTIRIEYARHSDDHHLLREISALMRRLCISLFPREQTASLTGEDWLLFLDSTMQDNSSDKANTDYNRIFSAGAGRVLAEDPYRQHTDVDARQLLSLCEQWITQIVKYAAVHKRKNSLS